MVVKVPLVLGQVLGVENFKRVSSWMIQSSLNISII